MRTRYVLFSRPSCPFCVKAQDLLDEVSAEYRVVNFEADNNDVLDQIKDAYDWKTVPMVFVKNDRNIVFVGGYDDLVLFLDQE